MSIDLDTPKILSSPAVKLSVVRIELSPAAVRVYYAWKAQDGSTVRSGDLNITGADYQEIATAQVTAGMVGQALSGLLLKGIKQKVKTMLGLQGIVQAGF